MDLQDQGESVGEIQFINIISMNNPRDNKGFNKHSQYLWYRIGSLRRTEIKIPVELCFYVLREKLLPTFKIYILLKMTCSGKDRITGFEKEVYSEYCGYNTIRGFENHLRKLTQLNWIGFNRKSKIYHIRGFEFIQKQLKLSSRTGFWFSITDMQSFDGIIYGAVIGYLSKSQGKKQRIDPEKGRSNQVLCKSPGFYPISSRALAKILNVSNSTASKMKQRAEEVGSIQIKRKRIIEPATHDVYKRLKETYPKEYLPVMVWKHLFYRRLPDLVKPELKYGTRKKFDQ